MRAADADTALLFLTLGDAARLPSYVRDRLGPEADRAVARLILDDVLQVEHAGGFVSGPPATDALQPRGAAGGRGRIGELSSAALRYAQELAAGGLPEEQLALRLYCYGTQPATPALAARLGERSALDAHLGMDDGAAGRGPLLSSWLSVPPEPGERAYWRSWCPRRARPRSLAASYKLYVSPDLDALGVALAAVAGSLVKAPGLAAFKLAADIRGLCRPDKLVVYFERLDDLHEAAARLHRELDGCPAHGVPFTAAVTTDGLLSWGADPPELDGATASWRLWVSQRLAEYLADGGSDDLEPWQFALARLRLDGIDTDTWIPASRMWDDALLSA
jgi:hypothetical protein